MDASAHSEHNCDERCDDYCRCGVIVGVDVSIDTVEMAQAYGVDDPLESYLIERLLVCERIHDPENWEFRAIPGYYGEELDGVSLADGVGERIDAAIAQLRAIPDQSARVEHALVREYGHVLPTLTGRSWGIRRVAREQLLIGSPHQATKAAQEELGHYRRRSGPLAMVIPSGDRFHVVDGYHRLAATDHDSIEVLVGRRSPVAARPRRVSERDPLDEALFAERMRPER